MAELQELATDPANEATVDLDSQTVVCSDFSASFDIDPHVKLRLLTGLDNIGETMLHEAAIAEFESTRPAFKPSLPTGRA